FQGFLAGFLLSLQILLLHCKRPKQAYLLSTLHRLPVTIKRLCQKRYRLLQQIQSLSRRQHLLRGPPPILLSVHLLPTPMRTYHSYVLYTTKAGLSFIDVASPPGDNKATLSKTVSSFSTASIAETPPALAPRNATFSTPCSSFNHSAASTNSSSFVSSTAKAVTLFSANCSP